MKDRYFASESDRDAPGGDAHDLATDAAALVDSTEDDGHPDFLYLNDPEADDHENDIDELGY